MCPGRDDYKHVYMAASTEPGSAFPFQSIVKVIRHVPALCLHILHSLPLLGNSTNMHCQSPKHWHSLCGRCTCRARRWMSGRHPTAALWASRCLCRGKGRPRWRRCTRPTATPPAAAAAATATATAAVGPPADSRATWSYLAGSSGGGKSYTMRLSSSGSSTQQRNSKPATSGMAAQQQRDREDDGYIITPL